MQITIDPTAGFCTGVVHSIRIAEEELEKGLPLYCLGEIIHNAQEIKRLRAKGLQFIDLSVLRQLKDVRVLIRAHGEPPETYRIAKENNITLIDTTCGIVSKLQRRIREEPVRSFPDGAQVVIAGREDHPEVIGLSSQLQGGAVVIANEDELDKIDFRKPVFIYSQTTFNTSRFESISEQAVRLSLGIPVEERGQLHIFNTVCRQVRRREKALAEFSRNHDVIVFISDPASSNGKYLFSICRENNPSSFFITESGELQTKWFSQARSAGITGATSTPRWLLQKVAGKITEIVSSQQD
jgi:4-hydroxy-3-methylbut-2-enyl diphosphate reductase